MKKNCLLLFLAVLVTGILLYGVPSGPDAAAGWSPILGAFFFFAAFGIAVFMWGTVLTRFPFFLPAEIVTSLVLGLGAFALAGECLALLGWLGYFRSFSLPMLAVFAAGGLAFACLPAGSVPRVEFCLPLSPPVIIGGFLFSFLFALSWIPDSMPDPLWYHLAAARSWVEAGGYTSGSGNAALFQSGAWDALLLWGNFLLGSPGDGGLIAVQFFGQWLHLIGAGILTGVVLHRLFDEVLPNLSGEGKAFVVLAAMLSVAQLPTLALAKNDWGASLFLFSAFFFLRKGKSGREACMAGLFLGLALSTKASVVFAALVLGGLLFSGKSASRRQWLGFAGGALLALLPWMLRNQIALGDPFFPALQSLFPARVGPSWNKFSLYYEGTAPGWRGKFYLLKEVAGDSPYVFLVPVILFLPLWREKFLRYRKEWLFCVFGFISVCLFCLKTGTRAEYRLFGPACLLLIAAGLGTALTLAETKFTARHLRSRLHLAVLAVALVYVSFFSQFPWRAPAVALAQARPAEEIRSHFGGTALAWIRMNLPAEKVVASANEHRLYYLSGRNAFRIWDNPALDQALYEAKTLAEVLAALRKEGIDYLIFTRMDWDSLYRKEVLAAIEAGWYAHPEAVVFGNENSKVIDLVRLQGALGRQKP